MAAPTRAQRFDAGLLKSTLNCNIVLMVHYCVRVSKAAP